MKKFMLILATALLSGWSAAHAQSCTLREYASLDMTLLPDGTVSVPIAIGGKSRNMIVDFSENSSSITPALANELGLRPVPRIPWPALFIHFHSRVVDMVKLPDIKIGSVFTKNFLVWLLPGPDGDEKLPANIDGVVGRNLLGLFDLEFDFAHKKLNVFSPVHCAGASVVYWSNDAATVPFTDDYRGHIYIDMTLDGKPVKTGLTSIEDDNAIMIGTTKTLFGIGASLPGMTVVARDQDGEPTAFRFPFKSLSTAGISITNPDIDILSPDKITLDAGFENVPSQRAHALATPRLGAELQIGMAELRKFRIFVAYREKMLYITPADARK